MKTYVRTLFDVVYAKKQTKDDFGCNYTDKGAGKLETTCGAIQSASFRYRKLVVAFQAKTEER